MKTTYYTMYETLIIKGINFDGYEVKPQNNLKQVMDDVYDIFCSEYKHSNNKHIPDEYLFAQWLKGLPSLIHVPFSNHDILEYAKKNNVKFKDEDDKYDFLHKYWGNLSKAFFTLKENM